MRNMLLGAQKAENRKELQPLTCRIKLRSDFIKCWCHKFDSKINLSASYHAPPLPCFPLFFAQKLFGFFEFYFLMSSWSVWRAANLQSIKCGLPQGTRHKLILIILRILRRKRQRKKERVRQRVREAERERLELCLMSWAKIWSNRETQGNICINAKRVWVVLGGWVGNREKWNVKEMPHGLLQSRIHNYNRKCFSLISSALQASDKRKQKIKYKRTGTEITTFLLK